MSNKVLITNSQKAVKVPSGLRILIRRACNAVLEYEHFEAPAEISVTFVDNAAIAELNNQYRNKPMPTDVLSFPLGVDGKYDVDENNGCKMLGDIVISMEVWKRCICGKKKRPFCCSWVCRAPSAIPSNSLITVRLPHKTDRS